MIVNSPNIQLKISPNLKYIALLHGNSLLLYRERTFLFEKNVKGLDLKLIAVSDKGDVLIQTQSELILIDLNQQETILNNKFKEGGILSDFNLINKKIFFYRKTQDKSFLNILAKKEVYLHELGMLNLETSKEEIFFSKKMESNDNIEFKLSPFSNYIIIKDKKIVEKINLSNYKVELSYELSDIQIVDYYINNSGDIVFYIRDKDKEALYFISNNSKFIIKLPEEVKDSIIISFNPNKIVLRLKTYPQIFILNKLGNIELKFLLNDIENLNYPMWAVLFPTYEDIIALYLRQFKLPLDMFYFTYENFRVEVSRWRVTEFKKAKTEDKLASLLEESIKEREQIIEQKSKEIEKFQKEILKHHKEDIQQQTQGVTEKAVVDSEKLMKLTFDSVESKVENIDTSKLVDLFKEENQQEEQETKGVLNKLEDQSQDQKNIYKKVVSEDELLKKALSETKEQAKSINYDISKLTKFLEEDSNEENNSEIINKLGNEDEQVKKPKLKIDFDKVLYDKEQTIKEKETKKLDLNTILTDEPKNEIKKDLNSPKSIESPKKLVIEEFEKLLENVENKIEKSQKIESKDLKDSVIKTETIKSESGLEIEIKKQLTPEDIKKITKEKEELLKQINELNFLKSIGDIDEEEYNKKINEIKKRLEEIKELLASNK
ncbi:MAG: hypothetical protein ACPL1F_01180 [bacterium]